MFSCWIVSSSFETPWTVHRLPGFSVLGIPRQEYWSGLAISFSIGSSWPRDWTCISCLARGFFTTEPPETSGGRLVNVNSPSVFVNSCLIKLGFVLRKIGVLSPMMILFQEDGFQVLERDIPGCKSIVNKIYISKMEKGSATESFLK